jgi:hypothetical protein
MDWTVLFYQFRLFYCKFRWEIDFEHITPDYKPISNDLLVAAAKSLNKSNEKAFIWHMYIVCFLDFHRVKVRIDNLTWTEKSLSKDMIRWLILNKVKL